MIQLIRLLRTIDPLSNDLRDALEDNLHAKEVKKKDFLLRAGQICFNIYFVEKGLLRTYYIKDDKEISSAFTKENGICLSIESFFSQQHGIEYIQALEDCHVYYISFSFYQHLLKEFPEFNTLCKILMERCLRDKEQRLVGMWMQTARERHDWLESQFPDIRQRVSAKQIASYLGVTESMISRVRNPKK